ncbi:MAG: toll/interleukin-1 receptor domain-containing protein [Solirubrobacteraceae bacterium]
MSADADRNPRIAVAARQAPEIFDLARPLSLAVRVDPALLRRMRLELTPKLGPGAESDLWFSPLVASRGADGFVLDTGVAAILREALAANPAELDRAAKLVEEMHRDEADSIRLEEAVTALALRRDVELSALEERLRPAVRALTTADHERRADVARWVLRALPRMPPRVLETAAAKILAIGASSSLGGRRVTRLGDRQAPLPQGAAWVVSSLSSGDSASLGVQLHERAIEFVEPDANQVPTFELPRTSPLYVELLWDEGSDQICWTLEVEIGRRFSLPEGAQNIRIRTLAGREFAVETEADEVLHRATAAHPFLSASVAFPSGAGFFVSPDRVLTLSQVAEKANPGDVAAFVWKGRQLAGKVLVSADGFCLLELDGPLTDAVVLVRDPAQAAMTPGQRWQASSGWSLANGVVDQAGRLTPDPDSEPLLAGSPVVVGDRLIGQVASRDSGGGIVFRSVSEIEAFLARAAISTDQRPMVYIGGADASVSRMLVALLRENGFDLWTPQSDIRSGDVRSIRQAIASCDAAVVPLSYRGVESSWIRDELSVLLWRRRLASDFVVIPVLLDDLPFDQLASLGIAELQWLRVRDPKDDLEKVVDVLAPVRVRPPSRTLAWLLDRIMAPLEAVSEQALSAAAQALPVSSANAPEPETAAQDVAMTVIEAAFAGSFAVTQFVLGLQTYLAPDDLAALTDVLTPLWVDAVAAERVREVAERTPGQRALCVNGSWTGTADAYVRRAWLGLDPPHVVVVAQPSIEDPTELFIGVTEAVTAAGAGAGDVVAVGPPLPSLSAISVIQQRLPEMVLFLLSGPEAPDPALLSSLAVELIHPLLAPGREDEARQASGLLSERFTGWREQPAISVPDPGDAMLNRLRPLLRYDSQERFFAGSVAMMTDNVSSDGKPNMLRRADGTLIASAKPASGETQLTLDFLGSPAYANGSRSERTDYLQITSHDAAADAARLASDPIYADRVYGRSVRDSTGLLWLQYWFFYLYDDQAFLGTGQHEGDWEMIQLRIGSGDVPDLATYAAGAGAQSHGWSELELTPEGAPVVYVARGAHACHAQSGRHGRVPLVADHADGAGRQVRPVLEIMTSQGWIEWPGRWGATTARLPTERSSPFGPALHAQWHDPARLLAAAGEPQVQPAVGLKQRR